MTWVNNVSGDIAASTLSICVIMCSCRLGRSRDFVEPEPRDPWPQKRHHLFRREDHRDSSKMKSKNTHYNLGFYAILPSITIPKEYIYTPRLKAQHRWLWSASTWWNLSNFKSENACFSLHAIFPGNVPRNSKWRASAWQLLQTFAKTANRHGRCIITKDIVLNV